MSRTFYLTVTSWSFIVSNLMVRSWIQFELISMYGVSQRVWFYSFACGYTILPTPFVENIYHFPHMYYCPSLKISWLCMSESISEQSIKFLDLFSYQSDCPQQWLEEFEGRLGCYPVCLVWGKKKNPIEFLEPGLWQVRDCNGNTLYQMITYNPLKYSAQWEQAFERLSCQCHQNLWKVYESQFFHHTSASLPCCLDKATLSKACIIPLMVELGYYFYCHHSYASQIPTDSIDWQGA